MGARSAIARELHDEPAQNLNRLCGDGVCDVLGPGRVPDGGTIQSATTASAAAYFHERWTKGENAPHEASERTGVKQVHAIRAQVFGIDPEALELALDLIRPRTAARGPLRIPSL